MHEVRDSAIRAMDLIIAGRMKHKDDQALFQALQSLKSEHISILREYIAHATDDTLFSFLRMIEEKQNFDLIAYTSEDKKEFVSLKAISDLLFSELYTDEGWIAKYSAYPPSIK
ncbi:MAG: hypothetical protein A2Y14_01260 [Verrucomicrobia bacterium GWF2_51_19]|nr:MAG: hypothetical protein A2Y14_01260 [Verrucomicrobia bacterium GWF2_51_19]